jgi:putative hydrolase of the HAD superfamily
MSSLRAILFDIDDTLFSTSEFARLARENAIRSMIRIGLRMTEKELMRELEEVIAEFSSNYPNHFDKLLMRIPRAKYRGVNPAVIVAAGIISYHQTKIDQLTPYPDAVTLLRALRRTDLTIGVVTDGIEVKQAEKLLRLGIYDLFDPTAIFISDQIGISKPNPKLYRRACTALGTPPSSVIYVGDNPLNDVDPPNSVGMHTVLLRRYGKYSHLMGKTYPDFQIRSFGELRRILENRFGVRFASSRGKKKKKKAKRKGS